MPYLYYAIFSPIVMFEAIASVAALVLLVVGAIRYGWRWNTIYYIYLMPLLVLYCHFILSGPNFHSANWISIVYWASQIACIGFVILPYRFEGKLFIRLFSKNPKAKHPFRLVLTMLIITLVSFAVLSYAVWVEAKSIALLSSH